MSDRSEQIVSQVQALWHHALGQIGVRASEVARQVGARLEHEKRRPHNGWLDRALKTSARIADGKVLPLPSRVQRTLGRMHDVIDTLTTQTSTSRAPSSADSNGATSQTKPRSVQAQPKVGAEGQDGETKRVRQPRKRRPRRREKTVDN